MTAANAAANARKRESSTAAEAAEDDVSVASVRYACPLTRVIPTRRSACRKAAPLPQELRLRT